MCVPVRECHMCAGVPTRPTEGIGSLELVLWVAVS